MSISYITVTLNLMILKLLSTRFTLVLRNYSIRTLIALYFFMYNVLIGFFSSTSLKIVLKGFMTVRP